MPFIPSLAFVLFAIVPASAEPHVPIVVAQASAATTGQGDKNEGADKKAPKEDGKEQKESEKLTPTQKMQRRFPQPTRVGTLIDLPVIDSGDVKLGVVKRVLRTADGSIVFAVEYRDTLARITGFGARLVALPLEKVAMLGAQVASVDMSPEDFAKASPWRRTTERELANNEVIEVAITRR